VNEAFVFDDLLRHVSNRSAFAPLADLVQPDARAARENSVVLRERTLARATEWEQAGQPKRRLVQPVTSPVTYQGRIQLRPPVVSRPPGEAQYYWYWFVDLISITSEYAFSCPVPRPEFGSMIGEAESDWFTVAPVATAAMPGERFAGVYELPTELSWGDQTATAADDLSLGDDFPAAFRTDPEGAVERLVQQVDGQLGGGLAAAKVLLPYLIRASYAQQNLFLDAVLRTSSPEEVLRAALTLCQGTAGEVVLEAAAGVLEHYGERSWPVLARLAATRDPRCRHFVRAIGYVPTADPQAKIDALVSLAKNPDLDTRWLASAVAEDVSPEAAAAVWRALCTDPDEQLRTTAQAQVAPLVR
jgi:hypothetical protein